MLLLTWIKLRNQFSKFLAKWSSLQVNTIFLIFNHRWLFRWQGRGRKDYQKIANSYGWFYWPEFDYADSTPRAEINVHGVTKISCKRRFLIDLFLILAVFRIWWSRSLAGRGFEFHHSRFAAANLRLTNDQFQERPFWVNLKTLCSKTKFYTIQPLVQRPEDQTAFFGLAVNIL